MIDIEITPEMIEAGEFALWDRLCGSDLHPSFCADHAVVAVFQAMVCKAKEAKIPLDIPISL